MMELKKQLMQYKPEDIQTIHYDFYRWRRFDLNFSDAAIHGIDTVRHLAGCNYKYIRFTYQDLPQFGTNVHNVYMDCIMESGTHAHLSFCPVSGVVVERATVSLFNNTYYLNIPMWGGYDAPGKLLYIRDKEEILEIDGSSLVESHESWEEGGFFEENKMFFKRLMSGEKLTPTLKDSLQSVLVKEYMFEKKPEFFASDF
jgi:predicted dehydrogenase